MCVCILRYTRDIYWDRQPTTHEHWSMDIYGPLRSAPSTLPVASHRSWPKSQGLRAWSLSSIPGRKKYCGWKKSCTTLDGWNPINHGCINWCRISSIHSRKWSTTRIRRSGFHVLNISYYSPRNGENQDDVNQIWIETRRTGGPRRKPRFWLPTRGTWRRWCLYFWCTFG